MVSGADVLRYDQFHLVRPLWIRRNVIKAVGTDKNEVTDLLQFLRGVGWDI